MHTGQVAILVVAIVSWLGVFCNGLATPVRTDDETAVPLSIASAQDVLRQRVASNAAGPVKIRGYVTAKRSFGDSFAFLDVAESNHMVQVMFKRQNYSGSNFDGIQKCLQFGSRIQIIGPAAPTRNPGEALVLAQQIQLLSFPRNPQHVKIILRAIADGLLDSSAMPFPDSFLLDRNLSLDVLSKQLVQNLPDDPHYPSPNKDAHYNLPVAPPDIRTVPRWNSTAVTVKLKLPDVMAYRQPALVNTAAWVQNRRRFQSNITILEVVEKYERANDMSHETTTTGSARQRRVKCLLHPGLWKLSQEYASILAPGSMVNLTGFVDNETLWITHLALVQSSWRPSVINYMFDMVQQNLLDVDEAACALNTSVRALQSISQTSLTKQQWYAGQISAALQSEASRMADIAPHHLQVLDKYKSLRKQYSVPSSDDGPIIALSGNHSIEGSRWKRQKEPQLNWMTNQVEELVKTHPKYGKGPIRILDIGGGQGFLANHMAGRLQQNVEIQVVDVAKRAIDNGKMRSMRRNLHNRISYKVADASQVQIDNDIDLVVALHACGALTDVALAHAVNHKASFVICPCCFRSNPQLRIPPSFISPEQWLGVDAVHYDALKLLAEVQGDREISRQAMHTICGVRATAVKRHAKDPMDVVVKTFPVAFSTRNYCLVGTFAS